jgi:hypothetical protein
MMVGRWWVVHGLESDGWRAGRKVQQDPRPQQQQIGLHTSREEQRQSWRCRNVVFIMSGCRKEKNERHFAWLLIALLVVRNLILYVCDCFSLVFVWHPLFFFSQYGGAIYNSGGALTFKGSATFTSCSAEASSSSSYARAVSGGE